jgi:hypothetical protein
MERTPRGTSVGVDDPYEHVGRCDHVTDDGRCRLAIEQPERDPDFARARATDGYACPVAADEWTWADESAAERVAVLGRRVLRYANIEPDPMSFESTENVGAND